MHGASGRRTELELTPHLPDYLATLPCAQTTRNGRPTAPSMCNDCCRIKPIDTKDRDRCKGCNSHLKEHIIEHKLKTCEACRAYALVKQNPMKMRYQYEAEQAARELPPTEREEAALQKLSQSTNVCDPTLTPIQRIVGNSQEAWDFAAKRLGHNTFTFLPLPSSQASPRLEMSPGFLEISAVYACAWGRVHHQMRPHTV